MRKYRNIFTEYNGVTYHSRKEAEYARELDLMLYGKQILGWDRQAVFSLDVNNKHICNYIVDFVLTNIDGTIELVEIKGYRTPVFNIKWNLMKALYGDRYKLTLIEKK